MRIPQGGLQILQVRLRVREVQVCAGEPFEGAWCDDGEPIQNQPISDRLVQADLAVVHLGEMACS